MSFLWLQHGQEGGDCLENKQYEEEAMGQVLKGLINPESTLAMFSSIWNLKQKSLMAIFVFQEEITCWQHSVSELEGARMIGRRCDKETMLIMMV